VYLITAGTAVNLSIPENVILLFQPAYSPEVNPIERLWGYVKEQLKWLRFDQREELRAAVQKELNKLTLEAGGVTTSPKPIFSKD
jgi:putative transposase